MDIYNKVRDIIIDVVTKRYNKLDIKFGLTKYTTTSVRQIN